MIRQLHDIKGIQNWKKRGKIFFSYSEYDNTPKLP